LAIVSGNAPPTLLNHGKEFIVFPNDAGKAILPCQLVNPTQKVDLFKGASSVRGHNIKLGILKD
jgi:hypothetical protein